MRDRKQRIKRWVKREPAQSFLAAGNRAAGRLELQHPGDLELERLKAGELLVGQLIAQREIDLPGGFERVFDALFVGGGVG